MEKVTQRQVKTIVKTVIGELETKRGKMMNDAMNPDNWLDVVEVAKLLGRSASWVANNKSKFVSRKGVSRTLIYHPSVADYIRETQGFYM